MPAKAGNTEARQKASVLHASNCKVIRRLAACIDDVVPDASCQIIVSGRTPEPMGRDDLPEGEDVVKIEEVGPLKEEEEPSWELPPELREFTGDPGDRRAAMAFTRAQNAARKACFHEVSAAWQCYLD